MCVAQGFLEDAIGEASLLTMVQSLGARGQPSDVSDR